jgi:hypothetical protein
VEERGPQEPGFGLVTLSPSVKHRVTGERINRGQRTAEGPRPYGMNSSFNRTPIREEPLIHLGRHRRPHNLKRPLHKIRFFIFRLFFVASFPKISYTKRAGRARAFDTNAPLTTNHLL